MSAIMWNLPLTDIIESSLTIGLLIYIWKEHKSESSKTQELASKCLDKIASVRVEMASHYVSKDDLEHRLNDIHESIKFLK